MRIYFNTIGFFWKLMYFTFVTWTSKDLLTQIDHTATCGHNPAPSPTWLSLEWGLSILEGSWILILTWNEVLLICSCDILSHPPAVAPKTIFSNSHFVNLSSTSGELRPAILSSSSLSTQHPYPTCHIIGATYGDKRALCSNRDTEQSRPQVPRNVQSINNNRRTPKSETVKEGLTESEIQG